MVGEHVTEGFLCDATATLERNVRCSASRSPDDRTSQQPARLASHRRNVAPEVLSDLCPLRCPPSRNAATYSPHVSLPRALHKTSRLLAWEIQSQSLQRGGGWRMAMRVLGSPTVTSSAAQRFIKETAPPCWDSGTTAQDAD